MKNISFKILFIIFIISIFLLFFSINSNAFIEINYDNENYIIPDVPIDLPYINYFIYTDDGDSYYLYNFDGDIAFLRDYFYLDIIDNYVSGFQLLDSSRYARYTCEAIYDDIETQWKKGKANNGIINSDFCALSSIFEGYCFSNVDIYDSIEKSNILFKSSINNTPTIFIPVNLSIDDFIPLTNIFTDTVYKVLPIAILIFCILLVPNLITRVVYTFI